MNKSVMVPVSMVALGAAFATGSWVVFAVVSALATVCLTVAMSEPSRWLQSQVRWQGWTPEHLLADVTSEGGNRGLPLYLSGMGAGLVPVTDWYTARVDGRLVVILEHLEGEWAQQ